MNNFGLGVVIDIDNQLLRSRERLYDKTLFQNTLFEEKSGNYDVFKKKKE